MILKEGMVFTTYDHKLYAWTFFCLAQDVLHQYRRGHLYIFSQAGYDMAKTSTGDSCNIRLQFELLQSPASRHSSHIKIPISSGITNLEMINILLLESIRPKGLQYWLYMGSVASRTHKSEWSSADGVVQWADCESKVFSVEWRCI